MTRDDFTEATKRRLSEEVDHHCVFPGCWVLTSIPHPRGRGRLVVGQAAHLSAAAENGPDYDPELTPEQRRALENGVNLCATHARLIDVWRDMFPLETARGWQRKAVENLRSSLGRPTFAAHADRRQVVTAVEEFLRLLNQCPRMIKTRYSGNDIQAAYNLLRACNWYFATYAPGAGGSFTASNPLHAGDAYAAAIQLSILQLIALFRWEIIRTDGLWMRDGYDYMLTPVEPFRNPLPLLANDERLTPIAVALESLEVERRRLRDYIFNPNPYTL
mgnify:CR=1 FL=1